MPDCSHCQFKQAEIDTLRDELSRLRYENGQLVKEANARDRKWMEGIRECCGADLTFDPLDPSDCRRNLQQFVQALRRDRDVAISNRDHWKANHDRIKAIKRALLDRPDLQDRAKSIRDLTAHLVLLRDTLNLLKVRISFIGLPGERMKDGRPDWSDEVEAIEHALDATKDAIPARENPYQEIAALLGFPAALWVAKGRLSERELLSLADSQLREHHRVVYAHGGLEWSVLDERSMLRTVMPRVRNYPEALAVALRRLREEKQVKGPTE